MVNTDGVFGGRSRWSTQSLRFDTYRASSLRCDDFLEADHPACRTIPASADLRSLKASRHMKTMIGGASPHRSAMSTSVASMSATQTRKGMLIC